MQSADNDHWYDMPSRVENRGFVWTRENLFRPLMAGVIYARYVVLAGTVMILSTQIVVFINGDVPWRFFNAPERGSITGNFMMLEGADREDTLEMMREFQRATEAVGRTYEERHGVNPID